MLSNPSDSLYRLRVPGYYIGFFVLLAQITDLLAVSWPARIHSPSWRITFVGGIANAVFMMLLVVFILTVIATVAGNRRVTFVLAGLAALATVAFLGATGTFALDALQMRSQVRQQLANRYDFASAWVLARILVGMVGFLLLSVTAFRSARQMKTDTSRVSPKGANLIVGGVSAPKTAAVVEKTPAMPSA